MASGEPPSAGGELQSQGRGCGGRSAAMPAGGTGMSLPPVVRRQPCSNRVCGPGGPKDT